MNGILPHYCRILGYVILILSVFVPIIMFLSGRINDSNLLLVKASVKLFVWFALFMIFLARQKQEDDGMAKIRLKSIYYAIYLLGIYYIVALIIGFRHENIESADSNIAILYMVFNVVCMEFFTQKQRIDRIFKNKK
ncbi:MAG: hypothetical protein ACTTJK_07410 [Phocaeicola sp.]|uniref:hypothetical protein n=1 Tax=Phocaeicola sp. TaxID=2773926 RepID=UPI003F9EC0B3